MPGFKDWKPYQKKQPLLDAVIAVLTGPLADIRPVPFRSASSNSPLILFTEWVTPTRLILSKPDPPGIQTRK